MIRLLEGSTFFIQDFIEQHLEKRFPKTKPNVVKNPLSISEVTDCSVFEDENKVIIWDFEEFKKLGKFNPYVIPRTVDIFVIGEKIDRRLKIIKELEGHNAEHKLFKDLYPNQVSGWILERCNKYKIKLHPEANQRLALMYGNNLSELDACLKRLIGIKTPITKDEVMKVASVVNKFSIFELQDAVTSRDPKRIDYIVKTMLKNGEAPVGIVRYFMSYFEKLLVVKLGDEELIDAMKMHQFILKKYNDVKFSVDTILRCLDILRVAEKKLISGFFQEYVLRKSLFSLCKIK
jgi:DNA polymerase III delta subunit